MDILQTLEIPQIVDILLLLIIFLCAVKGFANGFFTAAIDLGGNIVSLIAAWIVSKQYSPVIFDSLFREKATDITYNYIQDSANVLDIQQLVDKFVSGLPESFMEDFVQQAENFAAQITVPTMETAQSIVDGVIAPVLTAVITVVLFIIVFSLGNLIAGLLSKLFKGLNNVPVIGFANRIGGFAVGVVSGLINVILISCILSIIAIITQNSLSFINMDILSQSRILAVTAIINPFIG